MKMCNVLFMFSLFSIFLIILQGTSCEIISLTGLWEISNKYNNITLRIEHGADIFSAMAAQHLISDPLTGYGDTENRHLSQSYWTFSHKFIAYDIDLKLPVFMELDGIDLFAWVSVNKNFLLYTKNSFVKNTISIAKYLLEPPAENKLEINFVSTTLVADYLARQVLEPPPPRCWPESFHGECNVNMVRTTQASFGWDWGPAFPIQGFWKVPQLRVHPAGAYLGEGILFFPILKSGSENYFRWSAKVSIEIIVIQKDIKEWFCVEAKILDLMDNWVNRCFSANRRVNPNFLLFNNMEVTAWWPNGIRSGPKVFTLLVQLRDNFGEIIDATSVEVGFRQVELIQEEIYMEEFHKSYGLDFKFRINKQDVYVKGSNWIPPRVLPGRRVGFWSDELDWDTGVAVEELLKSAKMAGIQMLRVWGGGRYEKTEFYNQASRLGIMIWQDAMFACSSYYANTTSLKTISHEVSRQVRRLHHHPSIVVWATNNEIELAIANNWYPETDMKTQRRYYRELFKDRLQKVIQRAEMFNADKGYQPRHCLLSSPGNGIGNKDPDGISVEPNSPLMGDVHFYKYEGDLWNESVYPLTRFTSEFGVQSLPNALAWLRSLGGVAGRDNEAWLWNLEGDMMKHRQHQPMGMQRLLNTTLSVIRAPKNVEDPMDNFSRWAYVTQLNQAMAMKTHINMLERHKCHLGGSENGLRSRRGVGRNAGSLYWQLNDVWVAPSWSTIDATGQWKMAHYLAVTATHTSPIIGRLVMTISEGNVEVYWIPPHAVFVGKIQFNLECKSTRKFQSDPGLLSSMIFHTYENLECPLRFYHKPVVNVLKKCGCKDASQCALFASLSAQNISVTDSLLLCRPREIFAWSTSAGRPEIKSVIKINNPTKIPPFPLAQAFRVTVTSKRPELFVWLVVDPKMQLDAWFSENGFHLVQNDLHTVELFLKKGKSSSADVLFKYIQVISLAATRLGDQ